MSILLSNGLSGDLFFKNLTIAPKKIFSYAIPCLRYSQ